MSENTSNHLRLVGTEDPEATPLVTIFGVLLEMGGPEAFNPEYRWDQQTIADMLLDLNEKVYSYRGMYFIDEDVARMLKSFLKDFLI